ncbi:uncharacterized protein BKA78DRAFT_179843 [Phyllosticta capitalensis]|uniref:uncharacterized protein n=1 Tax=Phyllosticta capitalensis TaxID=121624 RepID=UPI00312DAB60
MHISPSCCQCRRTRKEKGEKKKEKEKLSVRHLSTRMGTCRNKVPPYMTPLPSSNNRKPALLDAHIHTKPPTYVPSTFKHLLSRAPVRRRLPCPALPCLALPCLALPCLALCATDTAPYTRTSHLVPTAGYIRLGTAAVRGTARTVSPQTTASAAACSWLAGWLAGLHRIGWIGRHSAPHRIVLWFLRRSRGFLRFVGLPIHLSVCLVKVRILGCGILWGNGLDWAGGCAARRCLVGMRLLLLLLLRLLLRIRSV